MSFTSTLTGAGWTTEIRADQVDIGQQAGELLQYNRTGAGPISRCYDLTADGIPTGWVGPGIVTGIKCITAGMVVGLYDAASATGTNRMPAGALAANQYVAIAGAGESIIFDVSPFFDITGGTYLVFGTQVE